MGIHAATRASSGARHAAAEAAFARGHDDEASAILRKWSAEYPADGWPYAMLAAIDALNGRDSDAAVHMARARELLPRATIAYVELLSPSGEPAYQVSRARLMQGLRKAGLPEG